ncbi:MAG: DNA polymerase III subunit delta' [Pseudomonadota bacterium]
MAKESEIDVPAPRENPLLFGHEQAQARFLNEFNRGLVHHAYLMTGHKGIGKATLAYRFARFILAQGAQAVAAEAPSMSLFGDEPAPPPATNPQSLAMDAEHTLFRRIAAGSHTDLLTLSPAYDAKKHVEKSHIGVDEARKVPEFLSLTPAEGLWRVVIVDAVDQLNSNAANALLKILEEPPERAILFLICHEPGGILPTIRSRCRHFKLTAPDATAFADTLNQIAPSIASHDYAALYALSHGSPGHAITLYKEEGLGWYEGWLAAMQPGASAATRQKFCDSAGGLKSPQGWATVMHGWQMAMQRLSLYPHQDPTPIFRREAEMLAAVAGINTPSQLQAWVENGNRLIHQTETFNLDKRHSIRLLADPTQLDMLAA